MQGTDKVYTHRIDYDFSLFPDIENMLASNDAKPFLEDWMIYDYWQRADNPDIRVDAKYDYQNVYVKDGLLHMKQQGFTEGDHVSMAGIQTKRLDSAFRGPLQTKVLTYSSPTRYIQNCLQGHRRQWRLLRQLLLVQSVSIQILLSNSAECARTIAPRSTLRY